MVGKELPMAEHRHCARHIFAHWHKTYRGDEMKMMFWACAKAYSVSEFNERLKDMRDKDNDVVDALLAYNPSLFCRAFIKTITTNDVIVNNMAETCNAYIINARAKHIIYMLEEIRVVLMQRLVKKKSEMEKKTSLNCPRVQAKLEKEKDATTMCKSLPSSSTVFEVNEGMDSLIVDLERRTCTCRRWDLTGVPCRHVVAVIYDIYDEPEKFVAECYRRETYIKIYSASISPCTGERHWPVVAQPLIPPPIKVGPGRPRKNRRKDPYESPKKSGKLTKHGIQMSCSLCNSTSHNKRKCPEKGNLTNCPEQPKRGRGRPRAPHNNTTSTANASETAVHDMSAQPTRIGKNGRVISGGKGGRR